MANKTEGVMAVCPFWEGDGMKAIFCEGIVGVHCTISFDRITERVRHEEKYCCTHEYARCPRAEALLQKYGEKAEAK